MLINKDDLVIDGINMGPYLVSAHWGYHKLWSSKTGRNIKGTNCGSMVGLFPKITMKFRRLNSIDVGILLSLFNKAENFVTFPHPDLKRKIINASFYSNDQEFDQNYLGIVENYSSAVISNKRREEYV